MISTILIGLTILFIGVNLYYFFTNKTYKKSYASSALFYKLFFVLLGITIGFAVLYYVLSMNEVVLRIADPTGDPAGDSFLTYLYFSGVTILSVGYGDQVPVGSARFFALIQASIGLLLPTAYFVKAITNSNNKY
ncbi:ion channel [Virgibacillus sp. C22-A2]|uniref:Ion channel n=1 Tax=Virgibacillus tibetensis TaxID=3042313 RepID=A0ABU6KLG2_9BACI|nr:ion channel [Virgibacillus sp. C22-A2]